MCKCVLACKHVHAKFWQDYSPLNFQRLLDEATTVEFGLAVPVSFLNPVCFACTPCGYVWFRRKYFFLRLVSLSPPPRMRVALSVQTYVCLVYRLQNEQGGQDVEEGSNQNAVFCCVYVRACVCARVYLLMTCSAGFWPDWQSSRPG